jgi:endonuclease YncB( thermonuclease family)
MESGFRADLIVENKVIVEIKSVESLAPVHRKQLLTYLRLAGKRLGLLINFDTELIKDGIARVVNGLPKPLNSLTERRQAAKEAQSGESKCPGKPQTYKRSSR